MKRILSIYIFSILYVVSSNAQRYGDKWILGEAEVVHNLYAFAGNTTIAFNDTTSFYHEARCLNFSTANASICEPNTGRVLFYTNGIALADSSNQIMQNGDSINFDPNFAVYNFWQSFKTKGYDDHGNAFILPKPNSTTEFYLFHKTLTGYFLPESTGSLASGVLSHLIKHTLIDMTGNNGLGRVVYKNQSIPFMDSVTSFAAVKHANGRDWWIVGQQFRMQQFFVFLLTPNGIEYHHTQVFPNIFRVFADNTRFGVGMNACFSPDGTKLGIYDLVNNVYLFDFNRCNGNLSNYKHISRIEQQAWQGGICFSPNSRFLYLTERFDYLHQYDTQADPIVDSDVIVAVNDSFQYNPSPQTNPNYIVTQYFMRPMLAPDNKIYVVSGDYTQMMTTIENPDIQGVNCNVLQHNIMLPTMNRESVPNYVNYKLGALNCNVSTDNTNISEYVKIFPNPAHDHITFDIPPLPNESRLQLYDAQGRIVYEKTLPPDFGSFTVNTTDFSNGVYLYRYSVGGRSLQDGKISILK